MSRRTVAMIAALAVTLSVSQAADKPPKIDADERSAELRALIQDFLKARKAGLAAQRLAAAGHERHFAESSKPKEADFLPRVHRLIADGAADDVAADALAFAVFGLDTRDEKVFDALARNFVKSDKIRRFTLMAVQGAPAAAKPVLEKVLADNPAADIRAFACYSLGKLAFEQPEGGGIKEAEAYFMRVEKDFANVRAGSRGTLGELAAASLHELRNLQVGMKAPPTVCRNLKGDRVSLADHLGKIVVLDFWATSCPPCRELIPLERDLVARLKDQPFVLISVSADDDKRELEDFLQKEPMPWTHWWDGADAAVLKQWNVQLLPTIYVIDAKGVIRYRRLTGEQLDKAVDGLLAEAKK